MTSLACVDINSTAKFIPWINIDSANIDRPEATAAAVVVDAAAAFSLHFAYVAQ